MKNGDERDYSIGPARQLDRTRQLREAVLLTFCDPPPAQCAALRHVSNREWQRLLFWLDTSGLALYFLDRMTELGGAGKLPTPIFLRLRQNLADSEARTLAMIAESTAIHHSFQRAGLSYATLKGYSLWPASVPKPELRSQLDLDLLMAENSAAQARQILESRGYCLHAISGRSWEFKANQYISFGLKDLYKATPQRTVELHIERAGRASLLARTRTLCFHGACMPVLHPVDLFLGQGLHLYKHLCGEFSRAAHLVEFRRHVLARHDDDEFWNDLRILARNDPRAAVGLGFVVLLITRVMGDFAPQALTGWTVERLPAPARLWVELYGSRTVFGAFPGNKLYLLLQKELQKTGLPPKRSLLQSLTPHRLPPSIERAAPGESLTARIGRHRRQARFVLFRLRFHVREGIRYLSESRRWHRHLKNEMGRKVRPPFASAKRQDSDNPLT